MKIIRLLGALWCPSFLLKKLVYMNLDHRWWWNFQNYFITLAKIEIRIWNIALIWLQKIEVRKYFNFMICRKLKSESKIIFWSDLDEIIFWKNIMISKYFSGRSQKYFWKYVFKIPKSYFFSKLFSDFDEVIFWNHIIFSKYFFIRSQKYFTEVIIFCAPLVLISFVGQTRGHKL